MDIYAAPVQNLLVLPGQINLQHPMHMNNLQTILQTAPLAPPPPSGGAPAPPPGPGTTTTGPGTTTTGTGTTTTSTVVVGSNDTIINSTVTGNSVGSDDHIYGSTTGDVGSHDTIIDSPNIGHVHSHKTCIVDYCYWNYILLI